MCDIWTIISNFKLTADFQNEVRLVETQAVREGRNKGKVITYYSTTVYTHFLLRPLCSLSP